VVGSPEATLAAWRLLVSGAMITLMAASLTPAAGAAVVTCDGRRATIVGTRADDVLRGTPGADVIAGQRGSDLIDGRGGDDRICGGFGNDSLRGGAGQDRLFGGMDAIVVDEEGSAKIGDQLRGGPGPDRLVPGLDRRQADETNPEAILWDISARPVHVDVEAGTASGDGRDSFVARRTWLVGSPFADTFRGGPARDLLDGAQGADEIRAAGGDDRVRAESGSGPGSADLVWGGPGSDELSSLGGEDVVHGGPGNDVIDDFGASADVLTGGRGNDLLMGEIVRSDLPQVYAGGAGRDQLSVSSNRINPTAAPSNGTWNMTSGEMSLDVEGAQHLTSSGFEAGNLSTFGASWAITGTTGPDDVNVGSMRSSTFDARGGNDQFLGSAFDDTFNGGGGSDQSLGMGAGEDTCISVEVLASDGCENVTP
jgi:Ca2+-binding RTX toxin-like protein